MKRLLLSLTFIFLLSIIVVVATAQTASPLQVRFLQSEAQVNSGELISNVLRIENTSADSVVFRINTDFPYAWKQLTKTKDSYTIRSGDSLFLPFRFFPGGNLSGNNRFMISLFLVSATDQPLGNDLFWAFTEKRTSWSMSSESGTKVYFRNGANEARFDVNLLNTGTERQQMILSINNMSLAGEIRDTLGSSVIKQPINLSLAPYDDTTFHFLFRYTNGARNTSRIDIENYRPANLNEERTFNLLVNSEEPNFGQAGAFQAGQRFTFKKLSDDKKADNLSFSHLPLIVDYNVANLFDDVSFATLNIRGTAQLGLNEQLIYNFQGSASNNQYREFLKNNNYYIGYFCGKGSVQLGYVNGGFQGIQAFGQGIKSSYMLGRRQTFTGYYITRKDKFDREALQSYGLAYDLKYFRQNRVRFELGQSENKVTAVKTTAFNTRFALNFLRTQSINLSVSNTWNEVGYLLANPRNTFGYFTMANYNGNFFRSRLGINHGAGYNTKEYGNSNIERFYYNHRTRWIFNDRWSVTAVNNYNKTTAVLLLNSTTTAITNQFMLNRSFKTKSFQPSIFYNIFNLSSYRYDIRGFGFNYNQFNPKTSARFSTTIEGGVNNPIDIPLAAQTTFLQWTTLVFYKTLTLNTRYLIGNYGYVPQNGSTLSNANQQLFTASAQHQYVFKNKKLMLQTGFNYFYNNVFKQHSITVFPDMYYFTTNGWRFRLGVNYNIISNIALRNAYATQQLTATEQERITNQNTFISLGVRKEFGLPIPFKRSKFYDVTFVAFFDVNGNGIKDKNERVLDNVVIKLGEEEVITNEDGEAKISNAPGNVQLISAMPLDIIDGWFPNIEDTVLLIKTTQINIPFVKGVKIKGKISIDREVIGADADEKFDLGRIQITANGQKKYKTLTDFNGQFELYLPYGKYIITTDENILGSRFKLARNNYEIEASKETDGMVISFLIIEKKRKVVKKVFPQPETPVKVSPAPPANTQPNTPRTPAPRRNNAPRRR